MTAQAQPQPYGRGHRALEIASIAFVFLALGWLTLRMCHAVDGARQILYVAATAVTGYLVADFMSGVVHWAGDTIGDQNTPIFGANFVTPFRYHHIDPKDITRHDFVETNGNNCIVIAPILAVLLLVTPTTTGWFFYACAVMAFTSCFVLCTNQFHKWAHEDHPARWVARAAERRPHPFARAPLHPPRLAAGQILLHHRRLDESAARQDRLLPDLRDDRRSGRPRRRPPGLSRRRQRQPRVASAIPICPSSRGRGSGTARAGSAGGSG